MERTAPRTSSRSQENWEPDLIAYRINGRMTVPLYSTSRSRARTSSSAPTGCPFRTRAPDVRGALRGDHPEERAHEARGAVAIRPGLLGARNQIEAANFRKLVSEKNYVIFSVDLVGMADDDFGHIANVLSSGQLEGIATMLDRMHQGMLNSLLAMRMMSRGFAKRIRSSAPLSIRRSASTTASAREASPAACTCRPQRTSSAACSA